MEGRSEVPPAPRLRRAEPGEDGEWRVAEGRMEDRGWRIAEVRGRRSEGGPVVRYSTRDEGRRDSASEFVVRRKAKIRDRIAERSQI